MFDAGTALQTDLDEAAVDGERLQVAFEVVAADHVENDVDATPGRQLRDGVDEIRRLVVDGALRRRGCSHARHFSSVPAVT